MAREEVEYYHRYQGFADDKHVAQRKERSKKDRCKRRKASTIRQGINHYFSRQQGEISDDEFDDFDDYDVFDDPSYH